MPECLIHDVAASMAISAMHEHHESPGVPARSALLASAPPIF